MIADLGGRFRRPRVLGLPALDPGVERYVVQGGAIAIVIEHVGPGRNVEVGKLDGP